MCQKEIEREIDIASYALRGSGGKLEEKGASLHTDGAKSRP